MSAARETVHGAWVFVRHVVLGARLPRRRSMCRHGWLTGPGPRACTAGCNDHRRNR